MFKRVIAIVTVFAAMFFLSGGVEAAAGDIERAGNGNGRDFRDDIRSDKRETVNTPTDGDNWLIYWYACGSDIESGRILFDPQTDLATGKIVLADPEHQPGDISRCIREIEKASLSPNVKVLVQAGGAVVWGHPKFQANNAQIDVSKKFLFDSAGRKFYWLDSDGKSENYVFTKDRPIWHSENWRLVTPGNVLHHEDKLLKTGTVTRYLYDAENKDWKPRKVIAVDAKKFVSDMGSGSALEDFLRYGRQLERELYPDGNVRRIFIFRDHGGGSLGGLCLDMYTGKTISLPELQRAFAKVWKTSPEQLDNPPFEVVAFDMCQMSTYETAVALEGIAHYMVASQEVTVGKVSYDYTAVLNAISTNPKINGDKIGENICTSYLADAIRTYRELQPVMPSFVDPTPILTISVIDITQMPEVTTAYENFGNTLLEMAQNPKYATPVQSNLTLIVDRYTEKYSNKLIDLKNFTQNIQRNNFYARFPNVTARGDELLAALDKAVIRNIERGDQRLKGGGLSTIYPFTSYGEEKLSVGERVKRRNNAVASYGSLAGIGMAPKSQSALYEELLSTASQSVSQPKQENPVMAPDSKADTDSTIQPNPFDFTDLRQIKANPDDTNTTSIKLTQDQLDRIAGVRGLVARFKLIEKDNIPCFVMLYLGGDINVKENWDSGEFTGTFRGKWLAINNQPVYTEIVSDSTEKDELGNKIGGSVTYSVPIFLNGRSCDLWISCSYPDEKFSVVSARPDTDTEIPSDELFGLTKGDVVCPRYPTMILSESIIEDLHATYGEDSTKWTAEQKNEVAEYLVKMNAIFLAEGDEFKIGDTLTIDNVTLPDGCYAYAFEFVNPIGLGNAITSFDTLFKVTGGNFEQIPFEKATLEDLR